MTGAAALGTLAALNGLIAVIAGTFGAHAMSDPEAKAWVATGALYGLVHAAAALGIMTRAPGAAWLMSIGALLFSGTLFLMAAGLPRWLGSVTPVGGTFMLLGWALLVWHFARS